MRRPCDQSACNSADREGHGEVSAVREIVTRIGPQPIHCGRILTCATMLSLPRTQRAGGARSVS
jgi:hypothetical protein